MLQKPKVIFKINNDAHSFLEYGYGYAKTAYTNHTGRLCLLAPGSSVLTRSENQKECSVVVEDAKETTSHIPFSWAFGDCWPSDP